jgi:hypothetical protein
VYSGKARRSVLAKRNRDHRVSHGSEITMKASTCYWLLPVLLLGASAAFAGCSEEPFSPEDAGDSGGEPGRGGSSVTAGKGGASSSGGSSAGGIAQAGGGSASCSSSDCGPQLGLPSFTCEDGSIAGPTGRCLPTPDGGCGWEVLTCSTGVGQAGAPSVGGAGSAGASSNGGASSDACGGCANGEICIYQVGGPGPSHFACAVQNPCGALGACACIVNQGTCEPTLAEDGYCHCDNGLD